MLRHIDFVLFDLEIPSLPGKPFLCSQIYTIRINTLMCVITSRSPVATIIHISIFLCVRKISRCIENKLRVLVVCAYIKALQNLLLQTILKALNSHFISQQQKCKNSSVRVLIG